MCIREGFAAKSNPLPFIFLSFLRKSYPFRIPSVDKWYLAFHIPCLELCIPFNCWKSLSFKQESITKIERFLALKSNKIHLLARVVTKISSCRVFVVSSRGSRKQSWRPPHPQEVFEVQLLSFSKRYSRPKKAIFIKSTAIISGFMMITSLLKKTTTL